MAENATPSTPAISDPRNLGYRPGPNGITLPAWLAFQADPFSHRADRDYNHIQFRRISIHGVKRMVVPNTTLGGVWVKTDDPNDVAEGVAAYVNYLTDAVLFSPYIHRPGTAGNMRIDRRVITLEAEERHSLVEEKVVGIVPVYIGDTSVLLEEDREAEKEAADRILTAATPEDFERANIDLSILMAEAEARAGTRAGAEAGAGPAVPTSTAISTTTPETRTPRQNKNRREKARLKRRKAEAKANAENGGGGGNKGESATEDVDNEHGEEANRGGQNGSAASPA